MHIINPEGKIIETISGFSPGALPEIIEELFK
jgi:hypothetical protein